MSSDVLHCKLFFPIQIVYVHCICQFCVVSKLHIASVLLLKCFPEFMECPYLEELYFWRRDVYQLVWLKNKILWNLAFEF